MISSSVSEVTLHTDPISSLRFSRLISRLINLEKRNDEIGSVCKVTSETEEDIIAEEDSDASEKTQNDIVNNENEE